MVNKLYKLLKKAFSRPKKTEKYLVVIREKCTFLDNGLGLVYAVESENPVKRGLYHSYHCNGLNTEMTDEEQAICKRCGYKRVRIIDAVAPYSYRKEKKLDNRTWI